MTTDEWNNGDVFRWRYKNPNPDHSNVTYWAKSRIGIVRTGVLHDTFWGAYGENAIWSRPDAERELALDFIANMADLEKVYEHRLIYYADSDVVNLNHANSSTGNAYIRKGAKRSADKMLEGARHNIQKALARIDTLNNSVMRLRELEAAVLAGDPLDELHLIEVS